MMRKRCTAWLVLVTFLIGMLPMAAFAADDVEVNIYGFNRSSESVTIFTKNVKSGDFYGVYLNDNYNRPVAYGPLARTGENVIQLEAKNYPVLSDLRSGDKLTVRITSAGFGEVLAERVANFDNAGAWPDSMTLVTNGLEKTDKSQEVKVRFDRDYEPSNVDELRLVPFDKDGNRLDRKEAKNFPISRSSLTSRNGGQEMTVSLTPSDKAAYYEVQFISGDSIADELTKKLTVGPKIEEGSELVLDYGGTTVKIGEKVTPKVQIKNKAGETVDVADTAVFTYTGDAVAEEGRAKGGFTVKDDSKYIDSKIIVTAVANGLTKTQTLKVVGKDDAAPSPGQKLTVIMNINSKDILVKTPQSATPEKRQSDAAAVIVNNRTFVPLRALVESFGAKVDFNEASQTVSVTLDNTLVVMTVGKKDFLINGKATDANGNKNVMDVEPYIVADAGRTMVPVRFVAQALGFKVDAQYKQDGTTASVLFSNYDA